MQINETLTAIDRAIQEAQMRMDYLEFIVRHQEQICFDELSPEQIDALEESYDLAVETLNKFFDAALDCVVGNLCRSTAEVLAA